MPPRPALLLEEWLPFETIGAESMRERGASSALPPLYFLHVWWARRPLTVSRAAVVASVLPAYETVAANPSLRRHFPTVERYHAWFVRLLGILGDPVAGRKLIQLAKDGRIELKSNPYSHDRAFTVNPTAEDLEVMRELLKATWGTDELTVLDPFAGGGSIPFEARRYGFDTIANELNPVAAVILKATLDYPARFGPSLAADIKKWGRRWAKRVNEKLAPYFPKKDNENIFAYLWARTVACPTTGKPVPLSPNWWLSKGKDAVAVRLLVDPSWDVPRFEIVQGDAIDFDPDQGTVSRGVGRSPWTGDTIDGDFIKREAQAGRMGEMLYAVAIKRRGGFDFRAPTEEDLEAVRRAEDDVTRKRSQWEASDLIPNEPIGISNYDRGHRLYGVFEWQGFFSSRQLLAFATYTQALRELRVELYQEYSQDHAAAIETYIALAFDKALDYNSIQVGWHASRQVIAHTFTKHNYATTWAFAEFDASRNLLPWTINQIQDAYKSIVKLIDRTNPTLESKMVYCGDLTILQGSATDLSAIPDGSIHAIVTDPPYYDNVMYAELADFFYVWLKRTAGHLYPDWFAAPLTNKDDEAVANPARFADLGRKKQELAARDYERKMAAAFREMKRVLRDDGVLTVMFTHKQVDAWDTLATALIGAGFSVESSWPVHTESEHSLHQARKNSAASTILLACRKRRTPPQPPPMWGGREGGVWWDDIEGLVRRTARETAEAFARQGITGVDLYISTFGPVLSVISQHWPVLTSEVDERTGRPKALRPETALDLAREEVVRLRKRGLLLGREVQFDLVTDWYLMAWDAFQAEQFPADEARKLAIALGLNIEEHLVARRVIAKKGSDVVLQQPKQRRGRGKADPEATTFATMLDAVHTAMLVYAEDGSAAAGNFLKRTGLRSDATFKAALQAMINAIPRTRIKGKFVRPEAEVLDRLRAAFFEELQVPPEEELPEQAEQLKLL